MIIQTVRLFMENPPPAPFVVFVPGDGWRFDCGNVVGWSLSFPESCQCGHCLPTYAAVHEAAKEAAGRACLHGEGPCIDECVERGVACLGLRAP